MEEKVTVSVLVALYEPDVVWLEEQLVSVAEQSFQDFEVRILDDASSDAGFAAAKEVCSRVFGDRKHVFIRHKEKNTGSDQTFEQLAKDARGSYLAFCDQDDIWEPQKLERLVRAAERSRAVLVYSDMSVIRPGGELQYHSLRQLRPGLVFVQGKGRTAYYVMDNCTAACSMLVTKAAADQAMPFPRGICCDQWIAACAAAQGKIVFLDEPLVRYRRHKTNQTVSLGRIKGKEDYYRLRVLPALRLAARLRRRGIHFPYETEVLRCVEARRRKDLRGIWKYRRFSRRYALLDLMMLCLPDVMVRGLICLWKIYQKAAARANAGYLDNSRQNRSRRIRICRGSGGLAGNFCMGKRDPLVWNVCADKGSGEWEEDVCADRSSGDLTEKRYAGENGGNQAGDLCADRDTVTVVLAADQAYVPVLSVCIASIVRTCDTYISDKVTDDKVTDDKVTIDKATIEDTASHTAAARPGEARKYRICIFHTDIQQKEIRNIQRAYTSDHFQIAFFNVSEMVRGRRLKGKGQITAETYYRFLIPWILRETEKVIYLDADTVVCRDLAQMYDTDLKDCLLGAAPEIDLIGQYHGANPDTRQYCDRVLRLADTDQYFQAGVLLWNTAAWRAHVDLRQLFEMAEQGNFRYSDQDILNIVCQGRVKRLGMEWNVLSANSVRNRVLSYVPEKLLDAYKQARRRPAIIHYAGGGKPWKEPDGDFAQQFWEAARGTPYYEQLLQEMCCGQRREQRGNSPYSQKRALDAVIRAAKRLLPVNSRLRRAAVDIYWRLK